MEARISLVLVLWTVFCRCLSLPPPTSLDETDENEVGDIYHADILRMTGARLATADDSPWSNTNWDELADKELENARKVMQGLNWNKAKNVIMFMGDGMGISTISAARLLHAEERGLRQEDIYLSWERFPHVGLSRTYNVDYSTSDSAGTATAFLCGVKANMQTIGVNDRVPYGGKCSVVKSNSVRSVAKESIAKDKWVGLVSTTRITHASPAGAYAHVSNRGFEASLDDGDCKDIALQLVTDPENQKIRVILGGGRRNFIPNNDTDIEVTAYPGYRKDGRYLIQEWLDFHSSNQHRAQFVKNKTEFDDVDPATTDYLMGLFQPSHMLYDYDRRQTDPIHDPSLAEMTEKAIKMLQRSDNGYFLFVEGGRIDHAHHGTNAYRSLNDTLALSDAVQKAVDLTDEQDTLIVVTADHSHVFSFGGYASFKQSVLDVTDDSNGTDGKPFLQLHYANGPGYYNHRTYNGTLGVGLEQPRMDLTAVNVTDPYFRQDAAVPKSSETHGGEDVGIFARGPMSHLFHGVHEQNYIGRVMMYASCVGRDPGDHCNETPVEPTTVTSRASAAGRLAVFVICAILLAAGLR